MNIEQQLREGAGRTSASVPTIFNLSITAQEKELEELLVGNKIQRVSDDYQEQQQELFAAKNPSIVYGPDFKPKFEEYYQGLQKTCSRNINPYRTQL